MKLESTVASELESPKTINRQYPMVMRCRCSREDWKVAKSNAEAVGLSLSAYIRRRATKVRIPGPVQDARDLRQMKQGFGLLKSLVKNRPEVRPLLQAMEVLIAEMLTVVRARNKGEKK